LREQVRDHLAHARTVAHDGDGVVRLQFEDDGRVGHAHFLDHVLDQRAQVDPLRRQAELQAALDAAHVQHLADHALHAVAGRLDAPAQRALGVGAGGLFQHHAGHVDRVERVAQVVAEHGQQLGAHGLGLGAARVRHAHQFAQHHFCMGQDAVFPRVGASAHGFDPGVEGAARGQAHAQWAELAFIGLAGPGHLFDLFGTQQDAPAAAGGIEVQASRPSPLSQAGLQGRGHSFTAFVQQQVVGLLRQRGDDGFGQRLLDAAANDAAGLRYHQAWASADPSKASPCLSSASSGSSSSSSDSTRLVRTGRALDQVGVAAHLDGLYGRGQHLGQHVGRHAHE
jgi:hypothetical protein